MNFGARALMTPQAWLKTLFIWRKKNSVKAEWGRGYHILKEILVQKGKKKCMWLL